MKPKPDIEHIFTQSQRPQPEFSHDTEDGIWLKVQSHTAVQSTRQLGRRTLSPWAWLVPIASAGAVAGLIWWIQTQPQPDTQLANTNLIENTNTETQLTEQVLEPRLTEPNLGDYKDIGGCPFCDGFPEITFTDPTVLPDVPTTAIIQDRSQLSLPELYVLAKLFNLSSDELTVAESGSVITPTVTFGCGETLLEDVADSCLQITPTGFIHYTEPANVGPDLSQTVDLISKLTGQSAETYVVQELTDQSSPDGVQQYRIYYPYSLNSLNEQSVYRDTGWHVVIENDQLRSLGGQVIPQMNPGESVELISPAQALSLLHNGIDEHIMTIDTRQLSSLIQADAQANTKVEITIDSLSLEYSFATSGSKLALVPVYYVRGHDIATELPFEIYIDPSVDQNLLTTYRLRSY